MIPLTIGRTVAGEGGDEAAWPMFRADARHTGCSPFDVSGNGGGTKWRHEFDVEIDYSHKGSIAMGPDGTVYMASAVPSGIIVIAPDGTHRQILEPGMGVFGLAMAANGTVYCFGTSEVKAMGPDGTHLWTLGLRSAITSIASIGPDGTIFLGTEDGNLSAISPSGALVWQFWTRYQVDCCPAIADDGTIYFVGVADDWALFALHPNGTLKWTYTLLSATGDSAPAIGPDGTVYCYRTPDRLLAIAPNGTLRWSAEVTHGVFNDRESWCMVLFPVIAPDGTIYSGSIDGLYAIDPNGTVLWRALQGREVWPSTVTADGTILVQAGGNVVAIDASGRTRWRTDFGDFIVTELAVGPDGTIFFATGFGYIALNGARPAQPSWPRDSMLTIILLIAFVLVPLVALMASRAGRKRGGSGDASGDPADGTAHGRPMGDRPPPPPTGPQ